MKQFFFSKSLLTLTLLLLKTLSLSAQWNSNTALNTEVSLATGDKYSPAIITDDSGGAIIVWRDSRNGNFDIYAQRIDINGMALWKPNGIAICTLSSKQQSPVITSDGKGGAIIVWDNFGQVSAQRVNARGVVQWTANGVPVTANSGAKYYPRVVSDDSGGAIIAWEDGRNFTQDIYAQRLNGAGQPQWTLHGIGICKATGSQGDHKLIKDGKGGAIIAWQDYRTSSADIYAQKVNRQGTINWTTDGEIICNANLGQGPPDLITDDSGGAIIAWDDIRSGKDDIYAQRINSSGKVKWTTNGVVICDAYDNQYQPTLAADSNGGAFIAWGDYRTSIDLDIYAQKIDASGKVQWAKNGIPISTVGNRQFDQKIISDGSGGAMIAWEDYRNSIDIYGQHITSAGQILWKKDGIALSDASASQFIPMLCDDQNGGMILTWHDNRNTRTDIYAQNVCFNGVTGYTSSRGPFNTTASQNLKICKGNKTKLTARGSGTISWYSKATGGIFLGSGSELTTPLLDSSRIFYVQDSTACGTYYQRTAITVRVSKPTDSIVVKTVCNGFLWHNRVLTTSGIYHDTVANAAGCDSLITLNLTVNKIDTAVIKNNNTLQAKAVDATYQWIDCSTQQWLSNDTARLFTAKKSGNYAVIVTKNNCQDTSNCYAVKLVSDIHAIVHSSFSFYPNPADKILSVSIENGTANAEFLLLDISGRIVLSQSLNHAGTNAIDVKTLQNGVYLLALCQNGHRFYKKINVQH